MEHDRTKCLTAGCNDFVTKPIEMKSLLKAMGRYLKVVEVPQEEPVAISAATAGIKCPGRVQQFYQQCFGW